MKATTIDNILRRFTPEEEFRALLDKTDRYEVVSDRMEEGKFLFTPNSSGENVLVQYQDGNPTREFPLRTDSITRAGHLVGVSEGLLNKLGNDVSVAFPLINHLFNKQRKDFSILVNPDTNRVEAFVPTRQFEYKENDVLDVALSTAKEFSSEVYLDKTFHSLEKGTYFSVVLPALSEDIKPGDVVAGGFSIRDSRLGRFKLEVATYTYRLVCSNGMMAVNQAGYIQRLHKEDYSVVMVDWLTPAIRMAIDYLKNEMEALKASTRIKVDNHVQNLMHQTLREFPLPKDTKDQLIEQSETATSLYDIINIFTAEANNDEWAGSPERIRALQRAGGYVNDHQVVCPHCNSLIT